MLLRFFPPVNLVSLCNFDLPLVLSLVIFVQSELIVV